MSPAAILRFFFSAASPARSILLHAARIGREVLFHEHVHAFFHSVLQVGCAEGGVRGQQGHVARTQAVDGVAVAHRSRRIAAPCGTSMLSPSSSLKALCDLSSICRGMRSAMATSLTGPPATGLAASLRPALAQHAARRPTSRFPPHRCPGRRSRSAPAGWCCLRRRGPAERPPPPVPRRRRSWPCS